MSSPPHLDPWAEELARPGRRPRSSRRARGARDAAETDLRAVSIPAPRRIAVVALKGGTGKTTLSVAMAATYARVRGENVLLFDADTRHGPLPLRTGISPVASARDLATNGDPGRLEILAGALTQSPDGVWVLPSGRSATESSELDASVYTGAMNAVYRHFPIIITDCGAGLATPLMQRVLSGCHSLVLASTATADGVLTTENAVRWLQRVGHADLLRRSIIVLTNVRPKGPGIAVQELAGRFGSSVTDVLAVPADPHLAVGGYLDLDALAPATRAACTRLATSTLRASC